MARKLTAIVACAVVVLFLFTFSNARAPLDLPENDVTTTTTNTNRDHNLVDLPDSDPKTTTTIILPSEKPETEPATFVELEPEETETVDSSKIPEIETLDSKDSTTKEQRPETETDSVPLTVITFRPINRHFARRPLIPFRRGHRCHGRRNHHFNQFKLRGGNGQRSYGDDMIVSGGEDLGFDREIPAGWARFNHGENRFSFMNEEVKTKEMNDRPPRHHHHHHHHHDHHEEEEEGEAKEHRHEYYNGGFMKGIRKFLNNF